MTVPSPTCARPGPERRVGYTMGRAETFLERGPGMRRPLLCRLGIHQFADFPDPNPESGGLEKQGYRACTRCPREKDRNVYVARPWPGIKSPRSRPQ